MCKGCLKELIRLRRHYEKELKKSKDMPYAFKNEIIGTISGLKMAISILNNKEFYGDK